MSDPTALRDGATFGNSVSVGGTIAHADTAFYRYADGSIDGPGYGALSVTKRALQGPGAAEVDPAATYTVTATWTVAGEARSRDLTVTAAGPATELHQIPEGTEVTLTELAPATTGGSSWGDPVFSSNDPAVVVAADGRSATVTIGNQTVVPVDVVNTAYGPPAVDIEKWSTNQAGPAHDARGSVTNDGYAGDHDGANAKLLDPTTPEAITFTVSNNGLDDLRDIVVTDTVTAGPALRGLSCRFPDATTGTTWVGPLAVGARVTCSATLPALGEGVRSADTARVTAVGVHSGTTVRDEDSWSGRTADPATPTSSTSLPSTSTAQRITGPGPARTAALASTGATSLSLLPIAGLVLTLGSGLVVLGRRASRRT